MKLSNAIEVFISGDWGEETYSDDTPCTVYCVRGADIVPITNHEFTNIPQRYVSEKTLESKLLQVGDIVIEKSGGSPTQSTGRVVLITEDLIKEKGNIVCSNFCTAIRLKNMWKPYYIYLYWQYVYNAGVFFNYEGKTSGIKNLLLDTALNSIEIKETDLATQESVCDIMQSIESKIHMNRAINLNLEAIGNLLYDYWFVQFDFPDKDGKPYKSSGGEMVWNDSLKINIPKYWEVKTIAEVLDKYPTTKKFATKEYQSEGKYPIVDQGPNYIVGWTDEKDEILNRFPAVLFGDHSTNIKFLNFPFGRGADGTQILYSNTNNISPYYLYQYVCHLQIPNPGYSRHFKYLKDMDIILPPEDLANKFEQIVSPLYKIWTDNIMNSIELERQRTFLLPMLINGQVRF